MTLSDLIKALMELEAQGKGDLPVYANHGASGAIDPVGGPYIATGDPEYEDDEIEYISLYIGN